MTVERRPRIVLDDPAVIAWLWNVVRPVWTRDVDRGENHAFPVREFVDDLRTLSAEHRYGGADVRKPRQPETSASAAETSAAETLGSAEVAQLLGTSDRNVRDRAERGTLPAWKDHLNRWQFVKSELEPYVNRRTAS